MQAELVAPLSANLATPINQAIQKSDGAQFALMLSLLFEARLERGSELVATETIVNRQNDAPSYHMNFTLNKALQGGSMAHFNLVNSLYHERSLYMPNHHEEVSKPILSDKDLTPAYSDPPENVLSDIQYAQNSLAA